jgi:GNAT superfamily N-acetyltransferase
MKIVRNTSLLSFTLLGLISITAHAMESRSGLQNISKAMGMQELLHTINAHRIGTPVQAPIQAPRYDISLKKLSYHFKNIHQAKKLTLGPVYYEGQAEKRDFLYEGNKIGTICYYDSMTAYVDPKKVNVVNRFISRINIDEPEYRGKGYGTYLMEQFIEQSRYDGISVLKLNSLERPTTFYLNHLGFSRAYEGSQEMIKHITPIRDGTLAFKRKKRPATDPKHTPINPADFWMTDLEPMDFLEKQQLGLPLQPPLGLLGL